MLKKSETAEEIIFSGEVEEVIKWRKGNVRDFWIFIFMLVLAVFLLSYADPDFLPYIFKYSQNSIIFWFAMIGIPLFILIILGVIQPLRITERGIYPPTRGIVNIFLMREKFIPFSKIKEFRFYNL